MQSANATFLARLLAALLLVSDCEPELPQAVMSAAAARAQRDAAVRAIGASDDEEPITRT
jgi:hypothetical protein